jgi:hypothetical protein
MADITITEALQEIKTINSRLEKKRAGIGRYIGRDARLRDPFEADGGSEKFIREERQSISDLEKRLVLIRLAIQSANLSKTLTLDAETRTVADWLAWRREVAPGQKQFLSAVYQTIQNNRQQVQKNGGKVIAAAAAQVNMDPSAPPDVVVNINEQALLKEIETLDAHLSELDGKLSLFNAVTVINV